MKRRRFITNAFLLTAATFALRMVSTAFSIFLSWRVGAEGIGLYQLTFSVYSLAITLSTSGISLAVTRIVSEAMARNQPGKARAALRHALGYSLLLGLLAGVLLFVFARPLALLLLREERAISSLKILSFGLPFLSTASVLRGYFLGMRAPIRSVSGDVVEQFAFMGVTLWALQSLLSRGVEAACAGMVIGSAAAEAISCVYSMLLYLLGREKGKKSSASGMGRQILQIAAPVALSNYFRSMLTTLENILVPPSLRRFGENGSTALAQYGMVKGMVMPVLLLPSAAMSAFASLLVPEVAGARAIGDERKIRFIVNRCFHATLLFAWLFAGIFLCFSDELGKAFYKSAQIGRLLALLAPLVPLLYLDQIVDSILKGLGEQVYSMKVNTADSLLRVLLILTLVTTKGIRGYLLMLYCGTIFNASLSMGRLIRVQQVRVPLGNWVIKPLCSIGFACVFSCLLLPDRLWIRLGMALLLYYLGLRISGSLKRRELLWLFRVFFPES